MYRKGILVEKNGMISRTIIPKSKKIVFLGDSITDDGRYIAFMEMYFKIYMPDKRLEFINLGVSGETASGLTEPNRDKRPCIHGRLDRALKKSNPEWVVICYGMNDGIYHPFSEERFQAYRLGITKMLEKVKKYGAKIILMTPPPFDKDSYTGSKLMKGDAESFGYVLPYENYDDILKTYSEWIMKEFPCLDRVVDIYTPLWNFIKSQRKIDPDYRSGDGIHPNSLGHWVIAKTLLKVIFNIHLERIPSFVPDFEQVQVFNEIYERFRMISLSWKEHVGHTNLAKDEALPLSEAKKKAEQMDAAILEALEKKQILAEVTISNWKGYERLDGYFEGREFIFVKPAKPAEGNKWIWRAEFFDDFSYADMEMLKKGWHLAYFRISDMYGCPEAVEYMHGFQQFLIQQFLLDEKTILFGFSRGGLYAFNYAAAYPQMVAAVYLDAPVLDIRSWPGGLMNAVDSPAERRECLEIYGLDMESLKDFEDNPVNKFDKIAEAGISVIIVAGDSDKIIPIEENTYALMKEFEKLGSRIKLIVKKGVGHHPHSLEDPSEITEFLLQV